MQTTTPTTAQEILWRLCALPQQTIHHTYWVGILDYTESERNTPRSITHVSIRTPTYSTYVRMYVRSCIPGALHSIAVSSRCTKCSGCPSPHLDNGHHCLSIETCSEVLVKEIGPRVSVAHKKVEDMRGEWLCPGAHMYVGTYVRTCIHTVLWQQTHVTVNHCYVSMYDVNCFSSQQMRFLLWHTTSMLP